VSRENTLLKCGKIQKCGRNFAATLCRCADGQSLFRRTALSIALFTTPRRWRVELITCLAQSRNGPKMVPCLLTST